MLGVCFFCSYCGKTKRNLPRCLQKKEQNQSGSVPKAAVDRNRTGTGITTHGILSPGRLPVPPLRHILFSYIPIAEIRRIRASTVALSRYVNGRRWIRTTEGSASRFTVCPLWPLGNSPMAFSSSNDDTIEKRKNQYFFEKNLRNSLTDNVYHGRMALHMV